MNIEILKWKTGRNRRSHL